MPLPTLYRYILRETAQLFFAILFILLAIILSFRLSSLLSAAVAGDMSLGAVWKLISLQAVNMLITIMPMALILAAVMTLGRLYRDHEAAAIFAGGISRGHFHRIILLFALPLAGLLLALTLYLLPDIYSQTVQLRSQARQQVGFALLTANTFRRLDDGTVIHTGDASGSEYQNFFIAQTDSTAQPAVYSAIFAQSGSIRRQDKEQFLELGAGSRASWDSSANPENAGYTQFAQASLHLPAPDNSSGELRERSLPVSQLTGSPSRLAELQNRFNPAIAMLIFSLCLPLLAHRGPRKGRQYSMLPAFILFAAYINTLDLAAKAVARGKLAVWPGSFSVHAAALAIVAVWWFTARKKR